MEQFENSTKTIKFSFTEWITKVVVFLFALPYVIVRYPVVFVLGLYAVLLPFDSLLGLSDIGTLTKYFSRHLWTMDFVSGGYFLLSLYSCWPISDLSIDWSIPFHKK
jgi:hypothetical protein